MSHDMTADLLMFVDEHPTTMVADLWHLMNEAPGMDGHADFELIAESLLRVMLCETVPEPVQAAARDLCQAYTAHALRARFGHGGQPAPHLLH